LANFILDGQISGKIIILILLGVAVVEILLRNFMKIIFSTMR